VGVSLRVKFKLLKTVIFYSYNKISTTLMAKEYYMEGSQDIPETGLPDWLAHVPMDVPKQTSVPIGENGKAVSAYLLMEALGVEVGIGIGAISTPPELAQVAAELTENLAGNILQLSLRSLLEQMKMHGML
jgi:hypothetical protein